MCSFIVGICYKSEYDIFSMKLGGAVTSTNLCTWVKVCLEYLAIIITAFSLTIHYNTLLGFRELCLAWFVYNFILLSVYVFVYRICMCVQLLN